MQRLTGARVMLREFRQEDLSGIRSWVNDYDTRAMSGRSRGSRRRAISCRS